MVPTISLTFEIMNTKYVKLKLIDSIFFNFPRNLVLKKLNLELKKFPLQENICNFLINYQCKLQENHRF